MTNMQDVLLTTYPGHKSRNVGDNLISSACLALVRSRVRVYDPGVIFREQPLDGLGPFRSILAPGFSISNNTYPALFKLYSDLSKLKNFWPVGCSFQHPLPGMNSFESYVYEAATLTFLELVSRQIGGIPCRDMLIERLLRRNGIDAYYCGDLALFDERRIGTPFRPSVSINSLVFTIQHHHARFDGQSQFLLELLSRRFPDAARYVSFHSKPNALSKALADFAVTKGFEPLELHGESTNLDFYDGIDLHVGYRLHGHISFLRRRKPSVLLVEDARSFGFANSGAFSVGCFDAFDPEAMVSLAEVPEHVIDFLDQHIQAGFAGYQPVFDLIDSTFKDVVAPYFDRFCASIA